MDLLELGSCRFFETGHQMQNPLCFLTATEISNGYRNGTFKPFDVVDSCLQRIADYDGVSGAFVTVMRDRALRACLESETRIASGRARSLEGIPIAVKDLLDIEGTSCGAGSPSRKATVSAVSATVVRKMLEHGAIIIGKTHTVEFAFGGWGTNQHLGTPRNPWSGTVHFAPGGSSSGSGVAVAARMVPLAIGTDTGGSVRVPAAFNGLVGLKTTYGRVSKHGVVPLSPSFDSVGVLARCVGDAALLFAAIQGPDKRDRTTYHSPPFSLSCGLDDGVAGLRVGFVSVLDREGVAPAILKAYDRTLELLRVRGADLMETILPRPVAEYGWDTTVMRAEAFAAHGRIANDPTVVMDEHVRSRILAGSGIDTASYERGRMRLEAQRVEANQSLNAVDVFLVPTTMSPSIPVADIDETTTASVLSRFVNQLGLCSLAVPNGFSEDVYPNLRLPLSVQIVCKPYGELLALRVGLTIEKALRLNLIPSHLV